MSKEKVILKVVKPEFNASLGDRTEKIKRGGFNILSRAAKAVSGASQWKGKHVVVCELQHRKAPYLTNEPLVNGAYASLKEATEGKIPPLVVNEEGSEVKSGFYNVGAFEASMDNGVLILHVK